MFEDLIGAYGGRLVIAIVGVGLAFVLLIGALWMIRGRGGPSPFVRGGKNRQPRLQVLDAAAVDTRRRLVLVRRDDVEHLIMIGGPTDIVIESGISTSTGGQQPIPTRPAPPIGMTSAAAIFDTEPRPHPALENRPAPRSAVVAPSVEPLAEAAFVPEPARPVRAIPPNANIPVPVPTAVPPKPAPAPVSEAPAAAPRPEPAVRPAPEVRPETLRPIAALAAANAASHSQSNNAAAVLDAARDRVLQPAVAEPRVIVPANAATVPPVFQPVVERPQQLGNDFEKILEQEMANNLAAREAPTPAQPNRELPPRDPAAPKVTGATPEPTLQSEVARIFGEMSVTRDK